MRKDKSKPDSDTLNERAAYCTRLEMNLFPQTTQSAAPKQSEEGQADDAPQAIGCRV